MAHGLVSPPGHPKAKCAPSGGRDAHVVGEHGGLEAIRWSAPWLAPYRVVGEKLGNDVIAGRSCADALNTTTNSPVRFVPQSSLPAGTAYEQYIFDTQRVPTRDGLHDFFNGLCWLHFPATKTRLNQLQAAQIAQTGIQPVRGPARDALTVFDENAAFFVGPDAVWDALVRKDWQQLFITGREAWSEVTLVLFGHALLEKLVYPRKPVTAHVFKAQAAINSIASLEGLDRAVAADLSADKLATKPFAHLPVLGVPGWWSANEDPQFYADTDVFRQPGLS